MATEKALGSYGVSRAYGLPTDRIVIADMAADGTGNTGGNLELDALLYKDATGKVRVGSAHGAAGYDLDVQISGTGTGHLGMRSTSVAVGFKIDAAAAYFGSFTNTACYWLSNNTPRWVNATDGVLHPHLDNTYSFGFGARRASVIYSASGTINTSDAREKTEMTPLTAAEMEVSRAIVQQIGTFRWLWEIERLGTAAPVHVGVVAQQLVALFSAAGLSAADYGVVDHSSWEAFDETPAGDRYGINYAQLSMFIAAGQEQALAALETRLAALEAA